jgi:hypothetical protein
VGERESAERGAKEEGASDVGRQIPAEEVPIAAYSEDLVVQGSFGGAAEGRDEVHKVRVLRGPLTEVLMSNSYS